MSTRPPVHRAFTVIIKIATLMLIMHSAQGGRVIYRPPSEPPFHCRALVYPSHLRRAPPIALRSSPSGGTPVEFTKIDEPEQTLRNMRKNECHLRSNRRIIMVRKHSRDLRHLYRMLRQNDLGYGGPRHQRETSLGPLIVPVLSNSCKSCHKAQMRARWTVYA